MSIAGITRFSPENLKKAKQQEGLAQDSPVRVKLTYDPYGFRSNGLPEEELKTVLTNAYAGAKVDEINLLSPNKFWLGQKVTLSSTRNFLSNWEIVDADVINCTNTEAALITGFTEPIIGIIEKVQINTSYLQELFSFNTVNAPTGVLLNEALKVEATDIADIQRNIKQELTRVRRAQKVESLCYFEYFVRFPEHTRLGRIKYFLPEAFLTTDLSPQAHIIAPRQKVKKPQITRSYCQTIGAIDFSIPSSPAPELDLDHIDWSKITPETLSSPAFKEMLCRLAPHFAATGSSKVKVEAHHIDWSKVTPEMLASPAFKDMLSRVAYSSK